MKNFFTDSSGKELEATYEASAPTGLVIIPSGTKLEVTVLGVDIEPYDDYGNNEHVVVNVVVTETGSEYRGIETKHKLHVSDEKGSKADKAKSMLLAYDTNHKGELLKHAKTGVDIISVALLNRALNGAVVNATYEVWEMTGSDGVERTGNWIRAIGSKKSKSQDANIIKKAKSIKDDESFDENIPF